MHILSQEDFLLALATCPYLTNEEAWSILKNTSNSNKLFPINSLSLLNKFCFDNKSLQSIISYLKEFDINRFKHQIATDGIKMINGNSNIYPSVLKEISSPPPFIFYKGNSNLFNCFNDNFCLAVVGSRKSTPYGQQVIKKVLTPICNLSNTVIISGLARGIDTFAHEIALNNDCPTIAVLGSGLFENNIYPPENIYLANLIVHNNGLIMSEFPPDMPPKSENFPQRNRIIAGLSRATLVIEATERSGALITARYALECNREVLAVPGNIFYPSAKGVNKLIQKGAYPIASAEDIEIYFS